MSIEIEAKMRLRDAAALEQRLTELGAERGPSFLEVNTYFDTDEGELKSGDQGLRVRVERSSDGSQRSLITHKGPRAHSRLKSRSETEVEVSDARTAAHLLGELGYVAVLTFEKRRQRWLLDGCRVELDTLPYIGNFVEIEGPSDDAVLAVREKIGLGDTPLIRASYIAMLRTYAIENHVRSDMIGFAEEDLATDERG